MEKHRVIGHVVSVHGFRLKVELSPEAKSSSRATLDGVQRAVAINSFLVFDLGAGAHALGNLTDLEARETYDPSQGDELSLELTKPRRIASVQLLGTVRQNGNSSWNFDSGITVLPTLDTPAEVADPAILQSVFGRPPERNRPRDWDEAHASFDYPIELGHQTGDENTKIKASFNDLFSRPLAIVGNTGSGKSYSVASLLRSVIENEAVSAGQANSPHIFILDINGEYANAFLSDEEKDYAREPNEAYVNGRKLSIPLWLMNCEEICEWLSAAEQTQQPVLKAWWAHLKSGGTSSAGTDDFLDEALASIQDMRAAVSTLRRNDVSSGYESIASFLEGAEGTDLTELQGAVASHVTGENFYGQKVGNPKEIAVALDNLAESVLQSRVSVRADSAVSNSGDSPSFVSLAKISDTANLVTAASREDAPRIDQHLTTLRMRLKARLADKRWAVFTNYEDLGIAGTESWFSSLGFGGASQRVTVFDLSMLAHEVLPYICATIGRVLLEAREKLPADRRYSAPWLLALEEAHNYARPQRQVEDRGQALSRKAFERVAKEGRKFGLSLLVASQRPSEISPTIISQCANFLSHRLQNPDDIDHFRRIIPRQAQRLLDQVTVLTAGEAIAFGSAMHVPARVKIRTPSREPWSTTAAPYVEWSGEAEFPLERVLSAWGIERDGATPEQEPVS